MRMGVRDKAVGSHYRVQYARTLLRELTGAPHIFLSQLNVSH